MDCSRLKQQTAAEPSMSDNMSEPSKGSAKRKADAANDVSQLAGDVGLFKRRSYWDLLDNPPAKKAKTTASQSSGVSQPTDLKVRILFADAGCIAENLKECLIPDHRLELSADDLSLIHI